MDKETSKLGRCIRREEYYRNHYGCKINHKDEKCKLINSIMKCIYMEKQYIKNVKTI